MRQYALVDNDDGFTVFTYGDTRVRFRAPYSLEKYVAVREWDRGYLVADAKYAHQEFPEEEYIDLVPILESLYIDAEAFLAPIREVRVANARS